MDEELKKEFSELVENVEGLRKRADKLESEGKSSTEERAKIAELGKDMGAAIEKMQAIEARQEETNKRIDKLMVKNERIVANATKEDRAAVVTEKHEEAFAKRVRMLAGVDTPTVYRDFMEDVETRDMLAGVDTTGGFLIPTPMSSRIIEKFIDINPVRQEATVVSITASGSWKEFREIDYPEPENEGETTTAAEDEVEFVEHEIKVHPIRSVVPISDVLVADVPAMTGLIERIVGRKFQRLESQNFVTGNDVKRARGFAFNIQAASNESDVWSVTGSGTQLVAANDFMALIKDVDFIHWPNGKFFMNQTTWGNVLNLKDSVAGNYLLRNLEAAPSFIIRGFPVVIMNTIANEGNDVYPVFFGDMRQAYVIVDRSGIVLLNDPYTDYPVNKMKFSKRVGGRIVDPHALRALKTT